MTKNYLATNKDLSAVDEALRFVWHPKMRFIFADKSKIANTVVVSYDSKFIYLWSPKPLKSLDQLSRGSKRYLTYKIPHKLRIKNQWQYAWCARLWDKSMEEVLPVSMKKASQFEIPRISGGLLTPFVELQSKFKKQRNSTNWPYTTYESYLATVIHEFGHIHWNYHKYWWPSNRQENLSYLGLAKKLYQGKVKTTKIPLNFPTLQAFGEVFAFCTEYYASSLFWPKHKKSLDAYAKHRLEKLIKEEKKKDLDREDSVLEPTRNPHDFASVFGKIILAKYPKNWPNILSNPKSLRIVL